MRVVWLALAAAACDAQPRFRTEYGSRLPHVPIFLRFKKSGTATAERSLFRRICAPEDQLWRKSCKNFAEESLVLLFGYSAAFDAGLRSRTAPAPSATPHKKLPAMQKLLPGATSTRTGGIAQFQKCVQGADQRAVGYTLIRNPLERVVSSLYFWGKGLYDVPLAEVSVGNVTRFRECQWAGCHYFGSSFVPNTAAVLSKKMPKLSPKRNCAARAGGCEVEVPVDEGDRRAQSAILTLATEFVVGVTDQMDDALALFALSLGDAIDPTVVCPIHYHENVKHKTSDAIRLWPAATIDFVNATLRQE